MLVDTLSFGVGAMFDSLAGMTFVSNSGTASFCDGHASFNKLTPYLNIVERTRPEGGRKGGGGKKIAADITARLPNKQNASKRIF